MTVNYQLAPTVAGMVGDNAAVAEVTYAGITAYGDSKRNKGERKNTEVGLELAIGRAFIRLGDELMARAYETLDGSNA